MTLDEFVELIEELDHAAGDRVSAYEWGTGVHGAERCVEEARTALRDAWIAQQAEIENLRGLIKQVEWWDDLSTCLWCGLNKPMHHDKCPIRDIVEPKP